MYCSNAAPRQPRTVGVVTVVMFHVVLVAGLLAMKNPISLIVPPALFVTTVPDVIVPPEPAPLIVPDDPVLPTTPPPMTFPLPEIPIVDAFDPTPSIPRVSDPQPFVDVPSDPKLPTGSGGDVRRSVAMPSRFEKPPYPTTSKRLGEEGISTIEACVTPKGTVSSARLVATSGYARLDDAALAWASKLRNFKPATLNGNPVAGCMVVPLEWKIEVK